MSRFGVSADCVPSQSVYIFTPGGDAVEKGDEARRADFGHDIFVSRLHAQSDYQRVQYLPE